MASKKASQANKPASSRNKGSRKAKKAKNDENVPPVGVATTRRKQMRKSTSEAAESMKQTSDEDDAAAALLEMCSRMTWDGYVDEDTWEPAANLAACQRLLASFWDNVGNEDYKEGTVVAVSETWIKQERKRFKVETRKQIERADKKAKKRKRTTPPKKKPNIVISGSEDSDDDVPLANLGMSPKAGRLLTEFA
ncbi:hypothetical protein B0H13DRAFT_2300550 [Mycena leptocephala]|nr:hypothetical protein B0H13DRAFT_2300550 [Mycena leptocephala]